ncbi:MAG: 50S ribosomal protein L6 [Gemmatimonadales bacterium]|jgi:large subunit ribosomal protein L6|nr:MAG: 50S ribosomal protein L6 [Gemmatimonadales bacterium]
MSRIGKRPVPIPKGVTVELSGSHLAVKGPKGKLERTLPGEMALEYADDHITVTRPSEATRHRALHGLTRSLVNNMVEGVARGFSKHLEIQGVGYRAETKPYGVDLIVGYSHPVKYQAPAGITISAEVPTMLKIEGADKELVGQVAAEIRKVRPPEPYKGKGIRYRGEHVRRKAGKTGAK